MYRFLANTVAGLHFFFMAWVVFGGLFVLIRPKLAWVHIPAVAWAVFMMVFQSVTCPLTWLELRLRDAAGLASYDGGFLHEYVHPCLASLGVPGWLIPYLGYVLLAINVIVYGFLIARLFLCRRDSVSQNDSVIAITEKIPAP